MDAGKTSPRDTSETLDATTFANLSVAEDVEGVKQKGVDTAQSIPELEHTEPAPQASEPVPELKTTANMDKAMAITGKSARTKLTKQVAAFFDKWTVEAQRADFAAMEAEATELAMQLAPKSDWYLAPSLHQYDEATWREAVEEKKDILMFASRAENAKEVRRLMEPAAVSGQLREIYLKAAGY